MKTRSTFAEAMNERTNGAEAMNERTNGLGLKPIEEKSEAEQR